MLMCELFKRINFKIIIPAKTEMLFCFGHSIMTRAESK